MSKTVTGTVVFFIIKVCTTDCDRIPIQYSGFLSQKQYSLCMKIAGNIIKTGIDNTFNCLLFRETLGKVIEKGHFFFPCDKNTLVRL